MTVVVTDFSSSTYAALSATAVGSAFFTCAICCTIQRTLIIDAELSRSTVTAEESAYTKPAVETLTAKLATKAKAFITAVFVGRAISACPTATIVTALFALALRLAYEFALPACVTCGALTTVTA